MPWAGGNYSGLYSRVFPLNNTADITAVDDFLNSMVDRNKQDSIVQIFMCPSEFIPTDDTDLKVHDITISKPTRVGGHTPRNKKLLTYPYCFLCVDCLNDSKIFKYELFGDTMSFRAWRSAAQNPSIALAPMHYNGTASAINRTEQLIMSGFPQCAYVIDSYRAWVAQRSTGDIISMGATLFQSLNGAMQGGGMGSVAGGISGFAQQLNASILDATKGNMARGTSSGDTATAARIKNFYFKLMGISGDAAEAIDSFFDRYGYTVNKLVQITPTVLRQRPKWTYIKTRNVSVNGGLPNKDKLKIAQIFDKGVTWWRNPSEVGYYNLNNQPA